jgi:hypothetical protein
MPTKTRKQKPAPTIAPGNPDDGLVVARKPGDREGLSIARAALQPSVAAAQTIKTALRPGFDLGLQTIIEALKEQTDAIASGDLSRFEAMLATQAHTLDALGHYLARRSMSNASEGYLDASETYMRLSLRAFSGCRANIETLAAIKNPPTLAIVRQANIGHAVQVNNGQAVPAPSRARGVSQESLNELLEADGSDSVAAKAPLSQATLKARN